MESQVTSVTAVVAPVAGGSAARGVATAGVAGGRAAGDWMAAGCAFLLCAGPAMPSNVRSRAAGSVSPCMRPNRPWSGWAIVWSCSSGGAVVAEEFGGWPRDAAAW